MNVTTTTPRETQRTSTVDALGPTQPTGGVDATPTDLLPEPGACGLCDGSLAELSMLLTKADEQDRTASRRIETAADQAATREENDHVAQLRQKADADVAQALATGIGSIAGGACQIAGGRFDQGTMGREVWNGTGQGLSGVGQLFGAAWKGDSGRADADASRSEAQAQADIRRYTQAHEDTQAANQSMQKVEQFLDQVQQTENATRLTVATFRA